MANAFRVSEACSLGLHAMTMLSNCPDRPVTNHEMARTFHVSENHLAKVMQSLVRAGLVHSVRGPRGGFALAQDAKDISLLQVYEELDGPLTCEPCLFGVPVCEGDCILGDEMKRLNSELRDYLQRTTLADLEGIYSTLLAKE